MSKQKLQGIDIVIGNLKGNYNMIHQRLVPYPIVEFVSMQRHLSIASGFQNIQVDVVNDMIQLESDFLGESLQNFISI